MPHEFNEESTKKSEIVIIFNTTHKGNNICSIQQVTIGVIEETPCTTSGTIHIMDELHMVRHEDPY